MATGRRRFARSTAADFEIAGAQLVIEVRRPVDRTNRRGRFSAAVAALVSVTAERGHRIDMGCPPGGLADRNERNCRDKRDNTRHRGGVERRHAI
jgi:hypothetical protein